MFYVSLLQSLKDNPMTREIPPPPPVIINNGNSFYFINLIRLVNKQVSKQNTPLLA